MRYRYVMSILFLLAFLSCNKNKFSSKPSLTISNVNSDKIPAQSAVEFTLHVTDAEGDIDTIFVREKALNCTEKFDTTYQLPSFPQRNNLSADIFVTFGNQVSSDAGYSSLPFLCNVGNPDINDTTVFRFAVKDSKGHVSDTVESKKIIFYK
jgi:hypothetical protein